MMECRGPAVAAMRWQPVVLSHLRPAQRSEAQHGGLAEWWVLAMAADMIWPLYCVRTSSAPMPAGSAASELSTGKKRLHASGCGLAENTSTSSSARLSAD
jgi:hypothetical protein